MIIPLNGYVCVYIQSDKSEQIGIDVSLFSTYRSYPSVVRISLLTYKS